MQSMNARIMAQYLAQGEGSSAPIGPLLSNGKFASKVGATGRALNALRFLGPAAAVAGGGVQGYAAGKSHKGFDWAHS
jgi:hypothetical protein